MTDPIIVPGYGRSPNDLMIVGEAPGKVEAYYRPEPRPFVGPSGQALNWYLDRRNLSLREFYLTNVCKEYASGNPDPTPEQIEYWTPILLHEIARVRPRVILPVGRFAVQFFLGPNADMESCHGIPHRGHEFDASYLHRSQGAVLAPCFHPAFGLHQVDARALLDYDYAKAAKVIEFVRTRREHLIPYQHDEYAGQEMYLDVTGEELADLLAADAPEEIGLDTEGRPGVRYELQKGQLAALPAQWSVQVSPRPGVAYTLRYSQPDFAVGAAAIQRLIDDGCLVITHDAGTPKGCLYDTIMCRDMGIELRYARQWNTMYAAYLLRLEPRGLKPLMYRHAGMRTSDYMGLIDGIARAKQTEYLTRVLLHNWPKPDAYIHRQNDGVMKYKKPQPVARRVERILHDIWTDKRNKEGEPVDPAKRWAAVDEPQRLMVERKLGPLPEATLDDVDLNDAVWYACRDADATRRVKFKLESALRDMDLLPLMETGNQVLPIFEEMQHTGMPASRKRFADLAKRVDKEMQLIQRRISYHYFDNKPFNPNSTKHVQLLLRRRGLRAEKKTSSGEDSTSKRSIEHLRRTDPAVDDVLNYRERAKILGTYALPQLRAADEQLGSIDIQSVGSNAPDVFIVRGKIKPVNIPTRRLAMEDPSLLNQPTRTELGRQVRGCYVTEDGEIFGGVDFSSQEVRVATDLSGDETLIRLYTFCRYCRAPLPATGTCRRSSKGKHKAGDPHLNTAVRVFGKPADQIDDNTERTPAKTAFFGILYGLSGMGLEDLFRMFGLEDWSIDDCENLISEIFKIYPGLPSAINRAKQEARRTGMIRDRYGMIRYLPAIWSDKGREVAEAGRQAFSHLVQGTAQGMIQSAMVWLKPRIRNLQLQGVNVKWCLQIHDELVFRVGADGVWGVVEPLVMQAFTKHCGIKLKVPIEAEEHYATNWGELK